MPDLPELNPVVHGKLRLALVSLLMTVEQAEFRWLRARGGWVRLRGEESSSSAIRRRFTS